METESGRSVRLNLKGRSNTTWVILAESAPRAVASYWVPGTDRVDLMAFDFSAEPASHFPLGVQVGPGGRCWLSPTGKVIVVISDGILSAVTVDGGQQLMAMRLPFEVWGDDLRVLDDRTVRIVHRLGGRGSIEVAQVNLENKTLSSLGTIDLPGIDGAWLSDDGLRVTVQTHDNGVDLERRQTRHLFDSFTLEPLGTSEVVEGTYLSAENVVSDCRIVEFANESGEFTYTVREPGGGIDRIGTVPYSYDGNVGLAGPDSILLQTGFHWMENSSSVDVIDVQSGATRRLGDGLSIVLSQWRAARLPFDYRHPHAFPTYWLFSSKSGAVLRWSPKTDELAPVPGLEGHGEARESWISE